MRCAVPPVTGGRLPGLPVTVIKAGYIIFPQFSKFRFSVVSVPGSGSEKAPAVVRSLITFPRTRIRVKYWEIIADNLSKAGWSWGCVSTVDSRGRTIFVADAHHGDGKRFVVRADERLSAFLELELAVSSRSSPPPS